MTDDSLTLSRRDLYELAWSKPMSELAKDFGISDVALAKRCRRLRIPVPGRGYWARVSAGQAPRRVPLPERDEGYRDRRALTVEVPRDESISIVPDEARRASELRTSLESLQINPSSDLLRATPAIKRSAVALKHPRRKELRLARGEKSGPLVDIRVGSEALERALLCADTLLRAAESLGWNLEAPMPADAEPKGEPQERVAKSNAVRSHLLVEGERIPFYIEERVVRELRDPQPAELARERRDAGYHALRVTLKPTGALRLVHPGVDYGRVQRKSWYDRRGRRLEGQIAEILQAFYHLALQIRARRAQVEWDRRERKEQERLRRELEERRGANAKLIEALEVQAGAWNRARLLRAYVRAARRVAPHGIVVELLGQRLDFLTWADEYINSLDPLNVQARSPDMLPSSYGWSNSSSLHEELARLSGHRWPDSWKRSRASDATTNDGGP